jgi:hypothetical protein
MMWAEEDIGGICYQAMASDDIEHLMCAVRSRVCELLRLL